MVASNNPAEDGRKMNESVVLMHRMMRGLGREAFRKKVSTQVRRITLDQVD